MIGKAVFAVLSADAAVSAIVSDLIYPVVAPPKTPAPRIVYTVSGGSRWDNFDGPSGLAAARVQVDAYAQTYAAARDLARRVRGALCNFRGLADGVRIGGVSMPGASIDFFDDDVHPALYRVLQDFVIIHDD